MFTARIRPAGQSGLLQGGFRSSVGEGLPDRHVGPPARNVRSEDAEVHADQHLLPHPPRPVRLRQGQHGWVSAGGPHSGVAGWVNMQDSRRDRRRGEGARLDAVHPRHQRRRQARRIHRAEPAVRSGQGPPHQRGVLRRVAGPRRHGVGLIARLSRATSSGSIRPSRNPSDRPRSPRSTRFRHRAIGPRGFDIDSKGVAWVPLSSGHMASFDRSKCKVLNGPTIRDGKHCPEGWTLYPLPGPKLTGDAGTGSAEASYYTWVDQHDILGLGKDVPFATGNENESLIALKDGKMVNLVVPYPHGLLRQDVRRPHRRPERRLEGPRHLGVGGQPHAVPCGRRQGRHCPSSPRSSFVPIRSRTSGQSADSRNVNGTPGPRGPGVFHLRLRGSCAPRIML